MVSFSSRPLLLLPLVSFYLSYAVALGAVVKLGGDCDNDSTCSTSIPHSECNTAKKCQCLATHYTLDSKTCVDKLALGDKCNATSNCKDANTMCLTSCKCINSHFLDTTCKPRILPNKKCGSIGNSSCVNNAYCNQSSNGFCVCGENFKSSTTSCFSAVTMAVAEISTILMCFMLAYLEVIK